MLLKYCTHYFLSLILYNYTNEKYTRVNMINYEQYIDNINNIVSSVKELFEK